MDIREKIKKGIIVIRKKISEFESKCIVYGFAVNCFVIIAVILLFAFTFISFTGFIIPGLTGVAPGNSLYPMQVFETDIIYGVQKLLGFPVEITNNIDLNYYSSSFRNGCLSMEISTACVGMHEMVFLSALIIGFRGVSRKIKFKWLLILCSVLFIENLVRIIILYPLALQVGEDAMWYSHYIFWKYGHLVIILTMFVLWVYFIARKESKIF